MDLNATMPVTLTTPRLLLRPFTVDDAPQVERLAGERLVAATTLNIPHPYPAGAAVAWIESQGPVRAERSGISLAITTADAGTLVGAVGIADIDPDHAIGELGYWIGLPYWGRGYASEAAPRLIDFARRDWRLSRIVARCLATNIASARVLEKSGLAREGCLRKHIDKWGVYEDVLLFGVVFPERVDPPAALKSGVGAPP